MAARSTHSESWIKSARLFIENLRLGLETSMGSGNWELEYLYRMIREARNYKTDQDRAGVWYDELRKIIIARMQAHGLVEVYVNRWTFAQLVPSLAFGKGEEAVAKYSNLATKYGLSWVQKNVKVSHTIYPSTTITKLVNDPRLVTGLPKVEHIDMPSRVEAEYEFVGKLTLEEKLEVSIVMGNVPALRVGPVPDRYKKGQNRNAKRKRD